MCVCVRAHASVFVPVCQCEGLCLLCHFIYVFGGRFFTLARHVHANNDPVMVLFVFSVSIPLSIEPFRIGEESVVRL